MISFFNWIENKSISEPQHKRGESSMRLDDVVEKRMMQMILELEREGRGSRQDILKSIKKTIGDSNQETDKQKMEPQNIDSMEPQNIDSMEPQN